MPLLSVIIPVYNAENTIKKCIDSILNQTFQDFEIIIVDDNSNDNSFKILSKYKNSKINLIKNLENIGAGASRNKGLQYAKGKYIGFVDNDDFVDKNYFQNAIDEIIKNDFDIAISRKLVNHFKDNKFKHFVKTKDLKELCFIQKTPPWAKIYKKEFLDNNDIKFSNTRGEDIPFAFFCAYNSNKITTFSNSSYHCTIRKNSISHSSTKMKDLDELSLYQGLINFVKNNRDEDYWSNLINKRGIISFDFLYSNANCTIKKEVVKKYREIFKKSPYIDYFMFKIKKKFKSLKAYLA